MPGIAGIVTADREADHRETLALMLETMSHETSYVCGASVAESMGVYAGWVAHADSFAQRQSEARAADGVDIVFAGECVATASQRHDAASDSVTALYRTYGAAGLERLNGLFSGLIVDRPNRRALLFNDRFGVERVYVHQTREATYFASEAKALLRVLPALRTFDEDGVADFLVFGSPLDGRTLFRGISQLPGGSVWIFQGGGPQKRRYFDPHQWESQPPLSQPDFQAEFENRFTRVVERYVGSPSRLGISLTGGVDTRLIMACLPTLQVPPVCYTFAGSRELTRDARTAARVAAICGLEHHILPVGSEFLSGFEQYVNRTVYITDACAGALGAHELYLNRQARDLSPIRLTGNFGSEVLRGMSTFKPHGIATELVAVDFERHIRDAIARQSSRPTSPVTFAAFREIPSTLFGTMAAAKSQVTFRTPYLDNEIVSLAYQTPLSTRRSPEPALALVHNRHPRLAEIPTDRDVAFHSRGPGHLLRRAAAELTFKLDYMHKEALAPPLLRFDGALDALIRSGLAGSPHRYLPYRRWFKAELASFVRAALADGDAEQPFWNAAVLAALAPDHTNGRKNYVREINAVVTIAAAKRLLLRFEDRPSARFIPLVVSAG